MILTEGEISFAKSLSIENRAGHPVEITSDDARGAGVRYHGRTCEAEARFRFYFGADSSRNTLTIDGGNIAGGNGGGIFVENAHERVDTAERRACR